MKLILLFLMLSYYFLFKICDHKEKFHTLKDPYHNKIDACVNIGNKVYFFINDKYIRYDLENDKVDLEYPKYIKDDWNGLTFNKIDSVLNYGNGKLYFFRGNEFVSYDILNNHQDDYYPQPIGNYWWNDIEINRVDASFRYADKVYFFNDNAVIVYDINVEKAIFYSKIKHIFELDFIDIDAVFVKNDIAYFFKDNIYVIYDLLLNKQITKRTNNFLPLNEDILNVEHYKIKNKVNGEKEIQNMISENNHKDIIINGDEVAPPIEYGLNTTKSVTKIPFVIRKDFRIEGIPMPLERSVRKILNSNDVSTIKETSPNSGTVDPYTINRENLDAYLTRGTNNPFKTSYNNKFLFNGFKKCL